MLTMNGGDASEVGSSESGSYVYEDQMVDQNDDEQDENAESDGGDDAFDVHARAAGEDDLSADIDPAAFDSDEAYARALQEAEEREVAARLMALARINDCKTLQFVIIIIFFISLGCGKLVSGRVFLCIWCFQGKPRIRRTMKVTPRYSCVLLICEFFQSYCIQLVVS